MDEIKKYDKTFLEERFKVEVKRALIALLNGISNRNLDNVKRFLSDEVYNKFNNLIIKYKNKGIIRRFDEANVALCNIIKYSIDNNCINIYVSVITKYVDYFINEDGKYISGNNDSRITHEHFIKFSKVICNEDLNNIVRCKNCGHSIDIMNSNVCEYCKSEFDISKHFYIITDIDVF